MKQNLFVMGLALAALSSCSQNEVLDMPESRTIQFDTYVGNPSRAASIIENDNFKSFYVFGGYYDQSQWNEKFDNANVYRGDGTAWGYDNLVAWETGKTWDFAAYSNGGIEGKGYGRLDKTGGTTPTVAVSKTGETDPLVLTITDYVTTDNKDLVVAFNHATLSDDNKVASFNFRHALAQVKFTIQSALGDNEIAISGFEVKGFKNKGTLTFTKAGTYDADEIKWGTITDDKTINALDRSVATTAESASGTYVIIPQDATTINDGTSGQLTVKFTATLNNHPTTNPKTSDFTVVINDPTVLNFKPGFCYNFIATIDGNDMDVISFDKPIVTEWKEDINGNGDLTDDEIDINN